MEGIQELYTRLETRNRLPQFLVLGSFLVTFGIARLITHLQRLDFLPNQGDILHIHHLVPGIFLLLISGYIGISFWINYKLRIVVAVLFGMGAALTIDEFALWLFLRDVYWEKQGRDSIDLVIIAAIVFGLVFLLSEVYDHRWLKRLKFSKPPK